MKVYTLLGILLLTSSMLFSQGIEVDEPAYELTPEQQEKVNQDRFYQIFLENPAQKIEKVVYEESGDPIEYELSPDGQTLILLDYNGKGRVTATVQWKTGDNTSITKPSCHIHDLLRT